MDGPVIRILRLVDEIIFLKLINGERTAESEHGAVTRPADCRLFHDRSPHYAALRIVGSAGRTVAVC